MLRAYCIDDITILRDAGEDSWGEPLTPTQIEVKGYVEWKTRLIRNIVGEQVVSRGKVYILYDGNLTHKDRVKIDGIEYVILDIREGKDFSVIFQELYLA